VKRTLDILASSLGLLLLAVPFAVIGLAVRMESRGGAFFRQERIGKGGVPFEILKFRTMHVDDEGAAVTAQGDSRITRVGRFLRRHKLDELPQLWNVLKGEMSLVGPRPEVPEFAFLLPEQERVWSVRPGITDPTSLHLRDEEGLLATQADPETYYREVLLPQKTAAYLHYLEERSLGYDVGVVFKTVWAILTGRDARCADWEERT